ncbi:MAG TPA: hypothetical protein VH592_08010 [Gemmataceae bacterium]|jgi:hypothetical protein
MLRFLLFSISAGVLALGAKSRAADDNPPRKAETLQPHTILLATQTAAKPPSALHYRLLPNSGESITGNAAPVWHKGIDAERDVTHKISQEEYKWAESDFPLRDLPRAKVQEFLARYSYALRIARQASLRDHCDWQQPLVTWQNMGDLPFPSIQSLRQIAFLLGIQCRLQLSERRFEDAADTLRIGFALARHVAEGSTLIESLVGSAIAQAMLSRIEEWMQISDSPNLYWPLTALPQPFIDVRRVLELELNTIYRSLPQLRELQNEKLSVREVEGMIETLFRAISGSPSPQDLKKRDWIALRKLRIATLAASIYPDARQALLDRGQAMAEVDAMPVVQVVLVYVLNDYDRQCQDVVKWLTLPPWQAMPGLAQMKNELRNAPLSNPLNLLFPAVSNIFAARVRLEHHIAALRCGEALRLYASAHQGQPPAKWSDITSVPLPIDPFTGKGFDTFYDSKDGRALLNIPELPGQGLRTRWRFEWSLKR